MANATVSRSTAAGAIRARSSSAAIPGRGARRSRSRPEPRDRPVLADDRRDVGDGPDRREVGEVERGRRAAGLVGEQQLGDLERDAAPGQAAVRVGRVGAVRVDDGDGRRAAPPGTRWWSVTMTSMPRASAAATSAHARRAAVDGDDHASRRPRAAASIAASDRPWPSSSRLGTYGSTVDAEAAQGERHDREAGQAVGIEVAEDQDPLAAVAGRAQTARASTVRVGQQRRVVEAVERLGEPGVEVAAASADAAAGEQAGQPRRDAARRRPPSTAGVDGVDGVREGPAEAGFDHDVRMPWGAAPRIYRPGCVGRPQDAVRRTRGAARRRSRRPCRRSSQSCQSTSSGLATKIDEYVPEMMPISSARTKSLIAAPPNSSSASSVMTTVRLVMIDRPNVCRIEWLTISANGSPAWRALFSRIAVEHDDRVVDAEADDGQHRGHEQGVDLDVEERAEDREDADDDDDVVEQRRPARSRRTSSRGTGR